MPKANFQDGQGWTLKRETKDNGGKLDRQGIIKDRDGFGPGPAQPKSARAYIPTWPKVGPGPKVAQRTLAQIGLGPNIFGPGPAQEIVGPDKWS